MNAWGRRSMAALWPSFLGAAVLEMVVFALVSPADLMWGEHRLALSSVGIYTVTFFVFWVVMAVTSGLTVALTMSSEEINQNQQ
jgi:hypothetical protein